MQIASSGARLSAADIKAGDAGGHLTLTTHAGTAVGTANNQVNALQIGVRREYVTRWNHDEPRQRGTDGVRIRFLPDRSLDGHRGALNAEHFAVGERRVRAVKKTLLLDLDDLGIPLDNIEGMVIGLDLPDGRRSLVLVTDNNFAATQFTQFLLFALD